MLSLLAKKIFGTVNERFVKSLQKQVDLINALESDLESLSDSELRAKTPYFKQKLAEDVNLDDILPEAFAVVREASKRVLYMRHFDVQLVGGIVLHKGMISEMRTGEGKTLVATLPAYLNALTGFGVHVVTVNDYLAARDAASMGKLYNFLGLSVGCIVHGLTDQERQEAYNADITYGTNNEFGFDYLRDNMKYFRSAMVQRKFNYAIVDEVDSILVDEARTPLIISGPTEDNSDLYIKIDQIMPQITKQDVEIDEKARTIALNDEGNKKVEEILKAKGLLKTTDNLYDIGSVNVVHHLNQALKAHYLFARDVDYIVKEDKVMIIDEFTGRMMEGRRYSEGLHQAIEAKEKVTIQNENQTLASITYQNYFRLYPKLAGMTGTAMTEADEFRDIYKLEVVEIPTNMPIARTDENDEIYRTLDEKYEAIVKEIELATAKKQPILVGTVSIEKSEQLSKFLKKKNIAHQVLNARYHEQEAYIVAQAGRPGSVTIATNMAGRGTDITLGGNAEMMLEENPERSEESIRQEIAEAKQIALEAGGLYVIGTERHESRRIDNQLRGRSGRQGDPGRTKFFLSLEDDLMRIFGSEKIGGLLQKLGLKDGEAIIHPWISRAIEKAQMKVEARNYDIRKNLLKFDDVMNDQRKVIYEQRIELMEADDISESILEMREEVIANLVDIHIPAKSYHEQWDIDGLIKEVYNIFAFHIKVAEEISENELLEQIIAETNAKYLEKDKLYGAEVMRMSEKRIVLLTLDQLWKDHLLSLDHLRHGINLRAYGQKDPLSEYKREAFMMFSTMLDSLRETVIKRLSHLTISLEHRDEEFAPQMPRNIRETHSDPAFEKQKNIYAEMKIGRNDLCPCNSGKKYKHCHGKIS